MVAEQFVTLQVGVVERVPAEEDPSVPGSDGEAAERRHQLELEEVVFDALQPLHHGAVTAVSGIAEDDHGWAAVVFGVWK